MIRIVYIILWALLAGGSPDSIVGDYYSTHGKEEYKVRVSENPDGTLKAQMIWMEHSVDPTTGKKLLDVKNPDKSLRNVPVDQIVLINGLKYNEAKDQWGEAKIYDPQRGIKANVTVRKNADGSLNVRGSLMGISQTVIWKKL